MVPVYYLLWHFLEIDVFFVWYDVDLHVILDDLTLDLQIRQEICFTQISFHSLCDLVSKPP